MTDDDEREAYYDEARAAYEAELADQINAAAEVDLRAEIDAASAAQEEREHAAADEHEREIARVARNAAIEECAAALEARGAELENGGTVERMAARELGDQASRLRATMDTRDDLGWSNTATTALSAESFLRVTREAAMAGHILGCDARDCARRCPVADRAMWLACLRNMLADPRYTRPASAVLDVAETLLAHVGKPPITSVQDDDAIALSWTDAERTLELHFHADGAMSWFYRDTPRDITAAPDETFDALPADFVARLQEMR